jgi:hypothetical protein
MEGINIPADKPGMLRQLIGEDTVGVGKDITLIRSAIIILEST